ncbi:MAG: ABC transporter ATP-binding protein [Verrucomicrobium sp.]|nr:ABC transporter ATP-binding protein [Verrucomicrobium sp.]
MPDTPALQVHDVHRRYRLAGHEVHALKGVSLSVTQGEKLFLCGASGSGKTTLLYILGGLEKPTQGDVKIGGQSLYASTPSKRAQLRNKELGFVFQNYHLLPELTAVENVTLPSMIGGNPALARAKELLSRVGLGERLYHLPTELSGGEQQRVALARALINDPPIILADEPTGNLDSATGKQIMDLLFEVVNESKKTLVVVTHDTNLAERGDRKLVLNKGLID